MEQKKKEEKSALIVNPGIEQPPMVNEDAIRRFKAKKRKLLSIEEYMDGIKNGNIPILSQAITLIESSLQQHQELARELVEQCLPLSGRSVRIGITGVPGVGKSTFIEAL